MAAVTTTLREANQRFARLIRAVEEGTEFVATRRGAPVARIAPLHAAEDGLAQEKRRALEETFALARKGYTLGGGKVTRAEIYAGRAVLRAGQQRPGLRRRSR